MSLGALTHTKPQVSFLSLYICSQYLSKLNYSCSKANLSSLRLSGTLIVLETVFYYYTCPHLLILCIQFRFLCNFYDLT